MLPVPTKDDLAEFTGRAADTYSDFADQALAQATLLFSVITKRDEYPDDADGRQLAVNAILELADRIYLEQPHQVTKASPFSSESIGSYSYSKNVLAQSKQGERTGLFWWDLAIDELTLVGRSLVMSGSVSVLERDDLYIDGDDGRRYVLGPADFALPDYPYDINAETTPRDPR